MVAGLREEDGRAVAAAVAGAAGARAGDREAVAMTCIGNQRAPRGLPFASVEDVWRASGCGLHALRRLAAADAFAGIGVPRQQALWQVRVLRGGPAPVLDAAAAGGATLFDMSPQPLPVPAPLREVAHDYGATGLSLRDHPVRFLRASLARRGAVPCAALASIGASGERPEGERRGPRAAVGGLVLCRQRPETASGVVFMTLEDESGVANLIIRPRAWERVRSVGRSATAVLAEGRVEHRSGVTHLLVVRLRDLGPELARAADGAGLRQPSRDFR
jgi:error-prone DNA polymerase